MNNSGWVWSLAGYKRNDGELLFSLVRTSEDGSVHWIQLENPEIRPDKVPRRLLYLQVRSSTSRTQGRVYADIC